ncbi:hypothetical protein PFISCL1PPCAC_16371, partial [Pristionchus fissidentatus]
MDPVGEKNCVVMTQEEGLEPSKGTSLELGLLAEVAAHLALLLVLGADLADGLAGALVVVVARTDLNAAGAGALGLVKVADYGRLSDGGKGGRGEGAGREGRGLHVRVPDAHLRVDVEDGGGRARHALPSANQEVVGGGLALEVVGAGLGVGGQGVDHPRADALVLGVSDASLDEGAGLGLNDGGLVSLGRGAVLLLGGCGLAVLVLGQLLGLAEAGVGGGGGGLDVLGGLSDGDRGGSGSGAARGRGKRWLVGGSEGNAEAGRLRGRARAVLVLVEGHAGTGLAGLRGASLGVRVERDRDGSEDLGSGAHTVQLAVGAGTLIGSLSDLLDLDGSNGSGRAEVVGGRVGRVAERLLSLDRSSSLAPSGRGDELVAG